MLYDVVVVGAGFSAIAMACNLIEALPAGASIAIIGDNPGFGRGTAYRTELHLHRLNVPAARLPAYPPCAHLSLAGRIVVRWRFAWYQPLQERAGAVQILSWSHPAPL